MKALSETWFADGYIDFELKKYTLLAYLQQVNKYFNENKLYPQLSDLIFHYNNLVAFRGKQKISAGAFSEAAQWYTDGEIAVAVPADCRRR